MQENDIDRYRRRLLLTSTAVACGAFIPAAVTTWANPIGVVPFGTGELHIVSDGHLTLPKSFAFPDSIDQQVLDALLKQHHMDTQTLTPDCNVALWRHEGRLILFDVGAGPNFMPTTGRLLDNLATAGIDPADVSDVVFTHAHPDHLWGLLDDFDEMICPNATYHMASREWDYWRAGDTYDKTPDNRKAFVVGAQNRFAVLEEVIKLFNPGQEVVPGVEAVETHGHTPGHASFLLHSGGDSIMLVGDAITNIAVSFAKPEWPSGSDQDPVAGAKTRVKLLDRLAHEQSLLIGYHLPHPGIGRVERSAGHYRFAVHE